MIPRSVSIFCTSFPGGKVSVFSIHDLASKGNRKAVTKSVIFLKLGLAFWQRPCYNNHVPVRNAQNKIWRISSAG